MDERVATNKRRWEEMTELHLDTYRVDERDAEGTFGLKAFEAGELGSIAGLRLCHLQSHLGENTFALAQMGATHVVGIDFSTRSVEVASIRAQRLGLGDRVRFVCATVDDAPAAVDEVFDGVYTSWGVLCWIPSLAKWARSIRELLRPGGWFYVADTHPYAAATRWATFPYGGSVAVFDDDQGDYTSQAAVFEHPESWEWNHGLGEVVTALVQAGLSVDWLHEHPTVGWNLGDDALEQRPDGMWELTGSDLPLSFSLRATRN